MSFHRPSRLARYSSPLALFAAILLLGTAFSEVAQAQQTTPLRGSVATAPRSDLEKSQLGVLALGNNLTLEAVLERALQENPEILAALARVDAAAERPGQAHSLPDPIISGILRNVGFGGITIGDEMMSQAGIRFTQAMPYKGKRDLKATVAERGIDVSTSQLALIMRRVVREVAEAYFELRYLDEAIDIVEDTRDYLISLEQTAEARYAVGEGIQQDVLKAQVETSILLDRLVRLDQQRNSVETGLNRLLDRPVSADLGAPLEISVPDWNLTLQTLEADAVASSAILREKARRVGQRQATLEFARLDTKPDWILSGAWMSRGQLPDIWEVNVGITLPIYKGNKQERAIVEAEAEVRASRLDHRDSTGIVTAAVRDHYLRADRAARLQELYGGAIIPQATLSLESAAAGYEVGRVDFLTVLDNVVTLFTYQLEYYRQRADYMQALAGMEEHVGHSIGAIPASIMNRLPTAAIDFENMRPTLGGDR